VAAKGITPIKKVLNYGNSGKLSIKILTGPNY